MTPSDLKNWRGKRSQVEAAEAIGKKRRQYQRYETGTETISQTVEMACAADVLGVKHINEAITLKKLIDETLDQ